MPSIATASPRTSELEFLTAAGESLQRPAEWSPCLLAIPCETDEWEIVSLRVNGKVVPVSLQKVAGEPKVIAQWERSGTGWYDIEVSVPAGTTSRRVRIDPAKISTDSFGALLEDLELHLPVSIAVGLRNNDARIGVTFEPPKEHTLATEVARLRRAVHGAGRPGLVAVINAIAGDPHQMLINVDEWVKRRDARRPSAEGLVQSLWRAGNLEAGQPLRVLDRRVEHTVDLYENRLMKSFVVEVERQLRALSAVLVATESDLADEVEGMLADIVAARRSAAFLKEVGHLRVAPGRVTMVLLKRREYRAGFEGYLEFRRSMSVHLDEPNLAEPLRNLPYLYQLWGALRVIEATLTAAGAEGFTVVRQQLVWPRYGGLYLKVLSDNQPALIMDHADGRQLRLFHERSYRANARTLGSISFTQRPDVAIEIASADGRQDVLIFDPKYKLVSEDIALGDGKPKKEDIDKMHSYRDAIRDHTGRRVVGFAATMYPGATVTYGDQLAALRAYPGEDVARHLVTEIRRRLADV